MKALLLFLLSATCFGLQAQQHDLALTNISVNSVETGNNNPHQIMLTFTSSIRNMGTDSILPTDSLFLYWKADWYVYLNFAVMRKTNLTVAPGENLTLATQVTLFSPDLQPLNDNYCVKLVVKRNGVKTDQDTTNNEFCEGHTGIDAQTELKALRVYPNPCAGSLFIEGAEMGSRFEINDLLGRTVLEGVNSVQPINVALLSEGQYIMTVYAHGEVVRKKILLQ